MMHWVLFVFIFILFYDSIMKIIFVAFLYFYFQCEIPRVSDDLARRSPAASSSHAM